MDVNNGKPDQKLEDRTYKRWEDCVLYGRCPKQVTKRKLAQSQSASSLKAAQISEEEVVVAWMTARQMLGFSPTAIFSFSPSSPRPGDTVTFNASESVPSAAGSRITSYEWDFDGDGQTDATGPTATYTFPSDGEYNVSLLVKDDAGNVDTGIQSVFVGNVTIEPPPEVQQPSADILRYDTNPKNCRIDAPELLAAGKDWMNDVIDTKLLKEVARAWENETDICALAAALTFRLQAVIPLISSEDAVTFVAQGVGITKIGVEVYALDGRRVFHSEVLGSRLRWNLLTDDGRRVANGVYFYVVTVRGQDGRELISGVKKLVLIR